MDVLILCTRLGECWECGGHAKPGARFCTEACRESYEDHVAAMATAQEARRAEERTYGDRVDALRQLGWGYRAIDRLLA